MMYSYMVFGNYLIVKGTSDYSSYYNPASGKTLKLFYSYTPTELSDDTDSPVIDSMYHSALTDYVLFALIKNPAYKYSYDEAVKKCNGGKTQGKKIIKQTHY